MCQLVIQVADTGAAITPMVEVQRFHPGDVVEIVPDNYAFPGRNDLGPHVKVVKMTGVSVAAMAQLIVADPVIQPLGGWVNLPRRRIWTIPGYAALPAVLAVAVPNTWIAANVVQRTVTPNAVGTPSVVI